MPDYLEDLGVQSYCFRNFKDNTDVARMVKACGLGRIEVCGVHADFQNPAGFDAIITPYREAGVKIGSIGVETFTDDADAARHRFEFAKAAGCEVISTHFKPDTYLDAIGIVEALCDEYGVKIAIHNHGGYHWLGNMEMLDHVFSVSNECVGLCIDTAWALDAGHDPIKMVEKFGDRLYGLHIKDFAFDRARRREDVVVGTGNLDLAGLKSALEKVGFGGYMVLEYEGDPADPMPAVRSCVEQCKQAWG